MNSKFRRGQVWFVRENPMETACKFDSHEQAKSRPYVIVSNNIQNSTNTVVNACPLSTRVDKFVAHVELEADNKKQVCMCEQIKTIDCKRLESYMFTIDDDVMKQIDEKLGNQLCLGEFTYGKVQTMFDDLLKQLTDMVISSKQTNSDIEQLVETKINGIKNIVNTVSTNNIRSTVIAPVVKVKEPEPVQKVFEKKKTWTEDMMKEFVKDYEILPLRVLTEKYSIEKKSTASNYYSVFRKKLGLR